MRMIANKALFAAIVFHIVICSRGSASTPGPKTFESTRASFPQVIDEMMGWEPVESASWKDYTAAVHRRDDRSRLTLWKNGSCLYTMHGARFMLPSDFKAEDAFPAMGQDITGDGIPNVAVIQFNGKWHFCWDLYILKLIPDAETIDVVTGLNVPSCFRNCDDEPDLEVVVHDPALCYWRCCYAGSPQPEVILKFGEGGYKACPILMRRKAPSLDELRKRADKARAVYRNSEDLLTGEMTRSDLWTEMVNLIYSGHMSLAWQFFETAWPHGEEGKRKFMDDFKKQLQSSAFWPAIEEVNRGTTAAEATAEREIGGNADGL